MMMFITAIQWKILDQIGGGPFIINRGVNNEYCSENWWKILTFTANLFPLDNNALSCMGHLCMLYIEKNYIKAKLVK